MNKEVLSTLFAIVTMFSSQISVANGDPIPIHLFCSNEFGIPADEGVFRSDDFCYQIEVSCEGYVSGGFLWGGLNPGGHIWGHMESVAGPPQPPGPHVPSCVQHFFENWQNGEFENSCEYEDYGKFKLKAKTVPLRRCDLG